jgi:hypothetical protein
MPSEDKSRLLELVRRTRRYSICEYQPGQFEIMDDRYLLDQLLRFPELRWVEFDEGLKALSPGPTLNQDDEAMLSGLMVNVELNDPNVENTAYVAAYAGACAARGTFRQVEYFLLAALDHRVQS